jgi:UDP-2,3-diacylglucosamine pyrophosphatase LpxH
MHFCTIDRLTLVRFSSSERTSETLWQFHQKVTQDFYSLIHVNTLGELMHYRAVFISDLHLGTPGCQAEALLDFLKSHESDYLYLVGDIVDGWQLRRKWFWPQAHNDVVQKILRRVRKGCQVVYIPGNHDEFARDFADHHFGGVKVMEEATHTMLDGRRLWLIHGDYFDPVVKYAKWLAYVGDSLYEFTLRLNRHFNRLRARLGLPYWSLSAFLKGKVKKALNFVADFEKAVAHEAHKRGYQGVVCGHIHRAEIREIEGVIYCNDGDWVESRSALVEHMDGRLELVFWDQVLDFQPAVIEAQPKSVPPAMPVPMPLPIAAQVSTTLSTPVR